VNRRQARASLGLVWLVCCLGPAQATDTPTLTLAAVLSQADAAHPDLDLALAQEALSQAEERLADSLDDFQVSLEGALATGRNPLFQDRFHPDHQARLVARKSLLDGGLAKASREAAREESRARGLRVMDTRAQRRLALMARYFDVLLTDMQYNADMEFLAVSYVDWDNHKERHALGQIPQWRLQELESRYQEQRARRDDTLRKLRESRVRLAVALNRDSPLTEALVDPDLPENDRQLPDLDVLLRHARSHNPNLLAHTRQWTAAQARREAVRAESRPTLELVAQAAAWSRESNSRDEARLGLNFVMPLWQAERTEAKLAREQARITALRVQQEKLDMQLREALTSLYEEIRYLQAGERHSALTQVRFRDMALEKAQAEYEMERKANLGASMAESQMARLRQRATEYRLALAWARLEALLGTPFANVDPKNKP